MKTRHKRLAFVVAGLGALSLIAYLIFNAFQGNLLYFFSPSDVVAKKAPIEKSFRLGGLVEVGSLKREDDGLTAHFTVTDNVQRINVTYKGILPDLFKEGKGVVAQGKLEHDGMFRASEVLAKHDENYMPPEVAASLKSAQNGAKSPAPAANTVNTEGGRKL
ncbi:MAG: cytochrome c maturation protein CcmE [Pseudomonadota bacterium]